MFHVKQDGQLPETAVTPLRAIRACAVQDTDVLHYRMLEVEDGSQFRHLSQTLEKRFRLIEKSYGGFETLAGKVVGDFQNVLSGSRQDDDRNTHGSFP
jgi:hypothetical protein